MALRAWRFRRVRRLFIEKKPLHIPGWLQSNWKTAAMG
jgi:hypothetical protein